MVSSQQKIRFPNQCTSPRMKHATSLVIQQGTSGLFTWQRIQSAQVETPCPSFQSIVVQSRISLLLQDKRNNVSMPKKSKAQHFILSFNLKLPPVTILNRTNKSYLPSHTTYVLLNVQKVKPPQCSMNLNNAHKKQIHWWHAHSQQRVGGMA